MKYARYVEQTILEMQNNGSDVAAFICESLLGCGGQIVLPQHYLKEAYSYIRNAGGVCIADEVQVGFGRAGTHFWGFETQGVVPDIVTMGKPRGILLSTNGPCHNVLKIKPPLVFTEENADFLVGTLDEVLGADVARV